MIDPVNESELHSPPSGFWTLTTADGEIQDWGNFVLCTADPDIEGPLRSSAMCSGGDVVQVEVEGTCAGWESVWGAEDECRTICAVDLVDASGTRVAHAVILPAVTKLTDDVFVANWNV